MKQRRSPAAAGATNRAGNVLQHYEPSPRTLPLQTGIVPAAVRHVAACCNVCENRARLICALSGLGVRHD